MKTLLIDGNNLYLIGYHGVKDYFSNNEHIGGIFHFINTIRKFLDEQNYDKVIVFWDSESNTSLRKQIYPDYKLQRRNDMSQGQYESYLHQRQRLIDREKYLIGQRDEFIKELKEMVKENIK